MWRPCLVEFCLSGMILGELSLLLEAAEPYAEGLSGAAAKMRVAQEWLRKYTKFSDLNLPAKWRCMPKPRGLECISGKSSGANKLLV